MICRVIGLAQDAKFANLQDAPPRTVYFPVTLETITGAGNLVFLMNAPTKAQAIAAYRKFGFATAYTYHYRGRPGECE